MKHFHIILILFLLIFNIAIAYSKEESSDIFYLSKAEEKNSTKNIEINPVNDRVISESTRKINAIYPIDTPTNSYPGYRGTNQLVIYTRDFAHNTGTNEFGKEAVVKNGIVVALTGADSTIPSDGYVVSGHGSAKKWINDNLKIGTKVEILDRTIKAYTTVDSYRYQARAKIKQVQEILISTKYDAQGRDDKLVYVHLKKAKQKYKKSKKDNSDTALNCAKEAIEEASLAFRYTLPYIKDELKGVWIRPNSKSIYDIQKTLDKIKETGINNVFIETYYHGRTIFPSRVMKLYGFEEQNPDFQGVDILALWIREAHKRNIKIHCWFESFYVGNKSPEINPKSILAKRPLWMNRTRQKADYEGWVAHPQEH
ncbi:family 10 glycosylhydrolase, partial [bacterium]|nr:family 10 glycosylhydrolase [bacterium]